MEYARKLLFEAENAVRSVQEFDKNLRSVNVASCAPAPLWSLLPELSARFLKNKEKKVLVYWKTENVQTKVMELLIGFEALEEFYSPTGKLLEFCELVAIAEQVLGIQIKNYRQLKSRVLKRYKEETVLDQLERLIEKLRVQVYK